LRDLITLAGVSKSFGLNRAVRETSINIGNGELVGLIGHNGAGKSTTMRMINGEHRPDTGRIIIRGRDVSKDLTTRLALELGIRSVPQELDIPGNLQIREAATFFASQAVGTASGWRRRSERIIMSKIDEIFPDHGISAGQTVDSLSISQRQMLAIALSGLWADNEESTCLVLDEPTSSLDTSSADSLYRWLRREAATRGLATLISTHKLHEVIRELDRAYIMADGTVVAEKRMLGVTRGELVSAMQIHKTTRQKALQSQAEKISAIDAGHHSFNGEVSITKFADDDLLIDDFKVKPGEIIGLGGLEGQGQKALLRTIFSGALTSRNTQGLRTSGRVSFVSGDRVTEGIFRHWDVQKNLSIAALGLLSRLGWLSQRRERSLTRSWRQSLRVRGEASDGITTLSGGSQQKVLIGRALADPPDILLLDDPTRGVDEETKLEIYAIVKAQADLGTAVVWYSTESLELKRCQSICVMLGGRIVDEFQTAQLDDEAFESRMLGASFAA
jgi:ribose transport system ATP-binding protein